MINFVVMCLLFYALYNAFAVDDLKTRLKKLEEPKENKGSHLIDVVSGKTYPLNLTPPNPPISNDQYEEMKQKNINLHTEVEYLRGIIQEALNIEDEDCYSCSDIRRVLHQAIPKPSNTFKVEDTVIVDPKAPTRIAARSGRIIDGCGDDAGWLVEVSRSGQIDRAWLDSYWLTAKEK